VRRVHPLVKLIGRPGCDELDAIRRELLDAGEGYGKHHYFMADERLERDVITVWIYRRTGGQAPACAPPAGGTEP